MITPADISPILARGAAATVTLHDPRHERGCPSCGCPMRMGQRAWVTSDGAYTCTLACWHKQEIKRQQTGYVEKRKK